MRITVSDDLSLDVSNDDLVINSRDDNMAVLVFAGELEPLIEALTTALAHINDGGAQQPTDTVPPAEPA